MLITLHSAKGLEFDVVFLPGWEEGLFPHQRSLDENGSQALEEERRLAYVAITRAKKQLYILTALNRRVYGQWQNNIPSRFINELPPQNIEICNNATKFYGNYNNGGYNNYYRNSAGSYNQGDYNGYSRNRNSGSSHHGFASASALMGEKVYHQTFGYGKVVGVEGDKLDVWFDNYGNKKLLKDYVTKVG